MVKEPEVGLLAQEGGHGGDVEAKHQAGNTRDTGDEVDVCDFGAPVEEVPESQRWLDHAVFVRRETHFRFWIVGKREGRRAEWAGIYSGFFSTLGEKTTMVTE